MAALHGGLCAACLFENALRPSRSPSGRGSSNLTIQMPLGQSASASVFLVKSEGPPARLLRLKVWHRPAAAGFLGRFHHLQAGLGAWAADIARPIAARLDTAGCPSVLTDFTQGVPILDRVGSGRLDREEAVALLTPLVALTKEAHTRGLAHGSIVAGNVIVDVETGRAGLLDFGLTPLMASADERPQLASADLAGFEALARTLRTFPNLAAPARQS